VQSGVHASPGSGDRAGRGSGFWGLVVGGGGPGRGRFGGGRSTQRHAEQVTEEAVPEGEKWWAVQDSKTQSGVVAGRATLRHEVPMSATRRRLWRLGGVAVVPPNARPCPGVTAAIAHCIAHSPRAAVGRACDVVAAALSRLTGNALMFVAGRGLMASAPRTRDGRPSAGYGARTTNARTTMTATDAAPTRTDPWAAQLEQLRFRYKHVHPPILAALSVLFNDRTSRWTTQRRRRPCTAFGSPRRRWASLRQASDRFEGGAVFVAGSST
jgi:hypothetical protein